MRLIYSALALGFVFVGCGGLDLYNPKVDEKLSVAKAQKDLKVGISSAEVIEIMGSPNIISSDANGNEVWVYDKVSSQKAAIAGGIFRSEASMVSNSRTLTIIVKFDENNKVRDVKYRTSSF